jgi:hypothetical protein
MKIDIILDEALERATPPQLDFYQHTEYWLKIPLTKRSAQREMDYGGGYKHYLSPTTHRNLERKFLSSTNEQGAAVSAENEAPYYDIELEREVAENILDWWISKKSYKQWYSEKYLQQKLDLDIEEE